MQEILTFISSRLIPVHLVSFAKYKVNKTNVQNDVGAQDRKISGGEKLEFGEIIRESFSFIAPNWLYDFKKELL